MGQHSKLPAFLPHLGAKHVCAAATLGCAQNPHHPSLNLFESITVTWLQLLGKPASQLKTAAVNPNQQAPH